MYLNCRLKQIFSVWPTQFLAHSNQLPVGLLSRPVEHCTGLAEARDPFLERPETFGVT